MTIEIKNLLAVKILEVMEGSKFDDIQVAWRLVDKIVCLSSPKQGGFGPGVFSLQIPAPTGPEAGGTA